MILLNAVQVLLRFMVFTRLLFSFIIVEGKLGKKFCSMMFVPKQPLSSQVLCITGGYIEKLIHYIWTGGQFYNFVYIIRGPKRYLTNGEHHSVI